MFRRGCILRCFFDLFFDVALARELVYSLLHFLGFLQILKIAVLMLPIPIIQVSYFPVTFILTLSHIPTTQISFFASDELESNEVLGFNNFVMTSLRPMRIILHNFWSAV